MSVRQAAVLGDGLGNDYATHLLKVPLTSNGTFLCLVLFFLVLSCLVLSCLVLSCLFLSCPVLSHLIWYCLVSSCLVLPCFVLCVFVLPCFVLCVFLRVTLQILEVPQQVNCYDCGMHMILAAEHFLLSGYILSFGQGLWVWVRGWGLSYVYVACMFTFLFVLNNFLSILKLELTPYSPRSTGSSDVVLSSFLTPGAIRSKRGGIPTLLAELLKEEQMDALHWLSQRVKEL